MLFLAQTKLDNLLDNLQKFTNIRYSGELKIKSSHKSKWTLYFHRGNIVWATGGDHPYRRLQRYIQQYYPQLEINKLFLHIENKSLDYWDYCLLEVLANKYQVEPPKIHAIVRGIISEILFDIAQHLNKAKLDYEQSQEVIFKASPGSTIAEINLTQIQEFWQNWLKAGLASVSPHLAPIVRQPEELQKFLNTTIYKNLAHSINGKYTLWDLSVKMNQNVLSLTRSLIPYIRKGIAELIEVEDLPLPATPEKNNHNFAQPNKPNAPLIACIDDSLQVCKMLEQVITANGLRFIKIQDSTQALPILIQHKPDLIFLDLLMPVVNGYEICAQLRRISALSNTPVVILTGNNGVFDQVRSKVYGATDFMTKPVEADKVVEIMYKYLPLALIEANLCKAQTYFEIP
ncbi:response regulator [Calothrix sp. FACHB-1219]|uniref:response regulator n=1 Tax=unclassified Calothrix TaxID=2619626 RepID=UPI0016883292|nr:MULTISPECIES: response regulator [unclassified Calothrix]MBD2204324.1 response regulator [Calothrix sp. FACHB-168]MBD2218363.1 response regulator [Calothrix sp. FACHB-1219]